MEGNIKRSSFDSSHVRKLIAELLRLQSLISDLKPHIKRHPIRQEFTLILTWGQKFQV